MILKALLVYKGKYERLFFFMYVWKVPSQQTKETDKKYEIFDFQVFQVRSWKTRNFFRVGFFIFWARIVPFWNMTKKWGCKAKFQKNIRNFFRENIRNDLGLESSISRNIRFFLVFLGGGGGGAGGFFVLIIWSQIYFDFDSCFTEVILFSNLPYEAKKLRGVNPDCFASWKAINPRKMHFEFVWSNLLAQINFHVLDIYPPRWMKLWPIMKISANFSKFCPYLFSWYHPIGHTQGN